MVRTVVTAIDVGDKGSAMRSINQVLDAISGKRVLVIGDAMLDHYLHGDVQRMSPEAPVPVLTPIGGLFILAEQQMSLSI